jgi:hypothetical protein
LAFTRGSEAGQGKYLRRQGARRPLSRRLASHRIIQGL